MEWINTNFIIPKKNPDHFFYVFIVSTEKWTACTSELIAVGE